MPSDSKHKPHILVVDDNTTIRNLVTTILGGQNMDVAAVSDGDEALAYIDTRRPDAVLLDLSMPRLDGLEVLRQIRGHPTLNDLCVVVLTAVANTPRYKEVHAFRPDGYLEKPFRINDLIDEVNQALARRQPE